MTEIWALAALWLGLALLAALLSIWLKVANALAEIVVDVCCFDNWASGRLSALRDGLGMLADHYGLARHARE